LKIKNGVGFIVQKEVGVKDPSNDKLGPQYLYSPIVIVDLSQKGF
jgi:hypothetical protein